ncbi:MAG: 6-phosphogluconate dehydrogenase, NADP(+)-dependent, decarboxylating [Saprospiraceae bacterium]|nr:MAG: 6-phosphogluconate dehydrogenase, NADP(+)-dependent, decarboxylating [Saprospiraceae bacterium]
MQEPQFDFGMIGLGTMGRNFILNVADRGFSAMGLDLDQKKVQALEAEGKGKNVGGTTKTADFVAALKTPRRIMMLVPAGKPVDSVIESLLPHLDQGDLLIDGGNSHFLDTNRRDRTLNEKGFYFIGAGVSGGAEGARKGPSIMPGGHKNAYEIIRPIFEAAAAKVEGEPCVAYMGKESAGHYVKMVHNGIEYGLMQLIAEAYDLLQRGGGLNNAELHQVFDRWNKGKLQSFLIEITAEIFKQKDPVTGGELIDYILDRAKQKGTGKWTSQNAMDIGIPLPTIDAAVSMRGLSALKAERVAAAKKLTIPMNNILVEDKAIWIEQVEQALHFSFLVTYSQGMAMLADASIEHKFDLDLEAIARIWRGGCIIRATILESIRKAYSADPDLKNLMVSDEFAPLLLAAQAATRTVIKKGIDHGIPLLALGSALHYFDAYRTARLPLNLVQAQRDFFGSHTYERTDQDGVFHTEWEV